MKLRLPVILDRIEQVIVALLFGWLTYRIWPEDLSGLGFFPILLLVSEGLVVLFILLRRPTEQISLRVRDWLIAAAGTFCALMVGPGGEPILAELGISLLVTGTFIHIAAKLSLRRSFGLVAANRGVHVSGMYALVRHPMYAGYMITHVGYLLLAPSLWNLAIYAAAWSLLIARIFAEERVLERDEAYRALRQRVRYRLIPGVY